MTVLFTIYAILGLGFWGYLILKLLLDNTISKKDITWMLIFIPHTTIVATISLIAYSIYRVKKS